jgi:hypothetical protein
MIPMKTSNVFKNRWFALIWAAGFIWLAYDVAGSAPQETNNSAAAVQTTDVTGAPVTTDDENKVNQIINGL